MHIVATNLLGLLGLSIQVSQLWVLQEYEEFTNINSLIK